jgi:phenylpropionate dioxygenase-like ring-hydroxylating dioxygenase large terminal subunit
MPIRFRTRQGIEPVNQELKPSDMNAGRTPDLRQIGAHPDYWYPVAWSHEVKKGSVVASSFAGEPIAIVRTGQGDIYALEDRCAHRQVPLSKGVVKDCYLHCCYHGWTYDASGRCVDVPYLGKDKLPNGVRVYPSCECDGVIFIWPGSLPAAPKPVALGAAGDKAYKTRRIGQVVNCHFTFMHENLMDMHHQFLHRRTTGKVSPRYLGQRAGDGWMELDYTFARPDSKPPLGESLIMGSFRLDTSKPRDRMTIRTEYPHQSLRFWTAGEEPVLHVWLGYTPVDLEQRKNRSFIMISVRKPKIPGVLELAWPLLGWFTNRVFEEDRIIVEMEQAAWDAQGGDWNQEVFPAIRDLRELLAKSGRVITARQREPARE